MRYASGMNPKHRRKFTESAALEVEAPNPKPISARQLSFIESLLRTRDLAAGGKTPPPVEDLLAQASNLTCSKASEWIDRLLTLPEVKARLPLFQSTVPAGRYALEINDAVKFYKVDRPEEGKWAGYVFVKIQAGGELHPVSREVRDKVLSLIEANPHEALIRYGHELGHCGVCGRELTDETSRANGIGPVCASKL